MLRAWLVLCRDRLTSVTWKVLNELYPLTRLHGSPPMVLILALLTAAKMATTVDLSTTAPLGTVAGGVA